MTTDTDMPNLADCLGGASRFLSKNLAAWTRRAHMGIEIRRNCLLTARQVAVRSYDDRIDGLVHTYCATVHNVPTRSTSISIVEVQVGTHPTPNYPCPNGICRPIRGLLSPLMNQRRPVLVIANPTGMLSLIGHILTACRVISSFDLLVLYFTSQE